MDKRTPQFSAFLVPGVLAVAAIGWLSLDLSLESHELRSRMAQRRTWLLVLERTLEACEAGSDSLTIQRRFAETLVQLEEPPRGFQRCDVREPRRLYDEFIARLEVFDNDERAARILAGLRSAVSPIQGTLREANERDAFRLELLWSDATVLAFAAVFLAILCLSLLLLALARGAELRDLRARRKLAEDVLLAEAKASRRVADDQRARLDAEVDRRRTVEAQLIDARDEAVQLEAEGVERVASHDEVVSFVKRTIERLEPPLLAVERLSSLPGGLDPREKDQLRAEVEALRAGFASLEYAVGTSRLPEPERVATGDLAVAALAWLDVPPGKTIETAQVLPVVTSPRRPLLLVFIHLLSHALGRCAPNGVVRLSAVRRDDDFEFLVTCSGGVSQNGLPSDAIDLAMARRVLESVGRKLLADDRGSRLSFLWPEAWPGGGDLSPGPD